MAPNRFQRPRSAASQLKMEPRLATSVPPMWMNREIEPAWLYTAITGNQRLLAGVDSAGEICQLFFPHIDAGPHIRSWLVGIETSAIEQLTPPVRTQATRRSAAAATTTSKRRRPTVSWLADSSWSHSVRYDGAAPTVNVTSSNAVVRVDRTLFVAHDDDVLVNEVVVTNLTNEPMRCQLVTYASFDPYYRNAYNTVYFDVTKQTLSVFGSGVYFALCSDAPVLDFATDKIANKQGDSVFEDVTHGEWNYREYSIGQVSGAVRYDLGELLAGAHTTARLNLCCGEYLADVSALAARASADPPSVAVANAAWQDAHAHPPLVQPNNVTEVIYDRSLSVISLLTDRTGAIIAAAECDPDFRSCGGYGMCWPRDGAFIAHALDVAGRHTHARRFYDWALGVQEPEGVWYQRYFSTGALAPTWGLIQFDETGAVVWAICKHIAMLGDVEYARRVWPRLVKAGDYMCGRLDADLGLAPFTKDLWEERDEISSYASACTWGAFHQLSLLAGLLGDLDAQRYWRQQADSLKAAITQHLWDSERGHFVRGRMLRVSPQTMQQMIETGSATADDFQVSRLLRKDTHLLKVDPIIDTASLALSVPFGVFAPDDPQIISTARAVENSLTSPVGGIYRYQGDMYRSGNPWVICTLWLAWQQALCGQVDAAWGLFRWVESHRTQLDLLPEQIDKRSGAPCWITALGWSHAMYILVAQALEAI